MKNQPVWMGFVAKALAGVVVAGALKLGLHLDTDEVIGALLLIEGAIAAVVQRKVTPMARLEKDHPATFAAMQGKK